MASTEPLPITTMIHMLSIKLTSSNFLLWKRQVMPMLTSFDLLGFVDGSSTRPAPTITVDGAESPNPAYSEWNSKDQKILGVLFSSLSEEAMAEVVDCATSRDAWLALECAFAHSSTSRAAQLREELLSLRRDSLSVQDYGKKFKALCDQLSAIGRPVDDSDKSHFFLRGLGAHFANFADTRMALEPVPGFTTLLHQAVQFDLMSKAMDASPSQSQVAFVTDTRRSNGSSQNSPRPPGSRQNSGNRSSQNSGSRGFPSGTQSGGRFRRPPRCQLCAGEHYANQCPLFLNRGAVPTPQIPYQANTKPSGTWVSMGVYSDGSYNIPAGLIYSFPVTCDKGEWHIVPGLKIDEFSREKMDISAKELMEEKALAYSCLN